MTDYGSLIILGIAVALFVQWVKKVAGTNGDKTRLIVLVTAVIVATVYYLLKDTSWWKAVLQVLLTAGGVYTYVIARFENQTPQ